MSAWFSNWARCTVLLIGCQIFTFYYTFKVKGNNCFSRVKVIEMKFYNQLFIFIIFTYCHLCNQLYLFLEFLNFLKVFFISWGCFFLLLYHRHHHRIFLITNAISITIKFLFLILFCNKLILDFTFIMFF